MSPETSFRWFSRSAFETECRSNPIDLYRALRFVNPSPYLFFLKLDDLTLIGSSPEVMVRKEEETMELRPIAGTRTRGKTEQEDRALSDELLSDEKERAEHVMLVDLGRNDLGRVAANRQRSGESIYGRGKIFARHASGIQCARAIGQRKRRV